MTEQLVSMGEPLIEFNQIEKGGSFVQGIGGDTSNVAIAAVRLGARCAFFSHVGADKFGQLLRESWTREGVDHSSVADSQRGPTGAYFITHDDSGHSFSYLRKGSAASRITPQDIPEDLISNSSILHFSAISQAISSSACDSCFLALELAKAKKVKISYDTNLRLTLWPISRARAIIQSTLDQVDILLPGLDDAKILTGLDDPDAIADFFLKFGVEVVAMTMGDKGALIATPDSRETIPPLSVKFVDASGAGDAFDGAFLSEILKGKDVFSAGRFANAAAALSTEGYGAVSPLPTRERVVEFIGKSESYING